MPRIFLSKDLLRSFQQLIIAILIHKLLTTWVKLLKGTKILGLVNVPQLIKLFSELVLQILRQTKELSIHDAMIKMSL